MKQALVGQGMYREQEKSYLEWPDHTGTKYVSLSPLWRTVGSPVNKSQSWALALNPRPLVVNRGTSAP